jgi:hypothetical protein
MSNVFALADWENPENPENPSGGVCTTESIDHSFETTLCGYKVVLKSSTHVLQCLNMESKNGLCTRGTITTNYVYDAACILDPIETTTTGGETVFCEDYPFIF